jgi:hypothetical protein
MRHKNTNRIIAIFMLVALISLFSMLPVVSAEVKNLGTFKQGKCVILKQTCANCTFVNITSVTTKNSAGASVQMLGEVAMTKIGTEYNYTFCLTSNSGEYTYNTFGNPDGVLEVQPVTFTINPSGNTAPLGLFIIAIGIIYFIGFFGFFGKHQWVSALGGMAMITLGIYTINNGIDVYRTFITDVFSWTTIGIGTIFTLVPLIEFIQENY